MVKRNTIVGYLTIDDSPSPDFRNKVDFLFANQTPAIFFCIGEQMVANPSKIPEKDIQADIIYAIKKGFLIGNHSWTHSYFNKLSEEQIKAEITKTDELIDSIYQKARVKRPIKLFRFPYLNNGGKNREYAQSVLRKLGYRQPRFKNINFPSINEKSTDLDIKCTFDTMDWTVANPSYMYGLRILDDIYHRMEEDKPLEGKTLNYPHSNNIVMMHDHLKLKEIFPLLVRRMEEKGIRFEEPDYEE